MGYETFLQLMLNLTEYDFFLLFTPIGILTFIISGTNAC